MKKIILSIIILAALITSCKKDKEDEPKVYAEENFYPAFLSTTGLDQVSNVSILPLSFEEGFKFKTIENGKINKLVIKLPAANNNVRIRIWDNENRTILRTENVSIPIPNEDVIYTIPAFNMVKDKVYFISMKTNSDYTRRRIDGAVIPYPVTIGNIVILGCSTAINSSESFPTGNTTRSFFGDLSFNFQQTK